MVKYHQRSASLEDYPHCPQCGYHLPVVHASGHPSGTFKCLRCAIRFEIEAP